MSEKIKKPKNGKSAEHIYKDLAKAIQKEVLEQSEPSLETCMDLIDTVIQQNSVTKMTVSILTNSMIGKILGKAVKTFKRNKRTEGGDWIKLTEKSSDLVQSWKKAAEKDSKELKTNKAKEDLSSTGLPQNASQYKARLVKYSKEMYKDPPVLPPPSMTIDTENYGLPQRNSKTGELEFQGGDCEKLKEFCPNRTPEEVLRAGSFGGTYFRAINSAVTNIRYIPSEVLKDTVKPEWIEGLNLKTQLTSQVYKKDINKYGVKCGGSLGMWESSGWISDADPYGWFQWYCRFYNGRRCEDDTRQVSRWLKSAGAKGRFRSQLCNKILAANTHADDTSISPVIRQTLLHWGLEITDHVLQKHRKRVGK
mmetsp:Transcript_12181/g.13512  ORF Transcript_12181/g.13512 Transcript_12181/m.13512 type:complete len:365 (+) Transcript_12181:67-1161(+)